MMRYRALFMSIVTTIVTSGLIVSCNLTGADDHTTSIMVDDIETVRQIRAFGDNEVILEIRVNRGDVQTFYFDDLGTTLEAQLTGVRLNETNTVSLIWYERLNGFRIAISSQDHQFIADGNTIINSAHSHTQFDYDNDGISNYDEREAGTCVWWCTPTCELDIPPDELANQNSNDVADASANILLNGSFNNGAENWGTSNGINEGIRNGKYCFETSPEGTNSSDFQLTYQRVITLQPAVRYTISADVDVDASSVIYAALQRPPPVHVRITEQRDRA